MSGQNEQLWATLVRAGLAEGAAPETGKLESPWYVKVLLAFSGWLAALFLLGFIGMGFEFVLKNSGVAAIVGGIMIGGAFALLRISANEFIEHLALAVSLAGQAIAERISLAALLGTFLLCAVSLEIHGLTAGMVILLLGFAGSHRVLLGLGMVSLLCSTSAYYYLLDATLLAKSLNLLIVGLVLLLLRWLMPAIIPGNKGDRHA